MAKPRIYYAHPMSWYNTEAEAKDIEALASYGTVTNPNTRYFQDRVSKAKIEQRPVMDIFANWIRFNTDVVAYRPFRDGKLGAGVAREILEAIIWGKPLMAMIANAGIDTHPSQFGPFSFGDVLTVEETRDRIARGEL